MKCTFFLFEKVPRFRAMGAILCVFVFMSELYEMVPIHMYMSLHRSAVL
jgi:hypothetical protein